MHFLILVSRDKINMLVASLRCQHVMCVNKICNYYPTFLNYIMFRLQAQFMSSTQMQITSASGTVLITCVKEKKSPLRYFLNIFQQLMSSSIITNVKDEIYMTPTLSFCLIFTPDITRLTLEMTKVQSIRQELGY